MNNIRSYTEYTIGGGWGQETLDETLIEVAIIRGTDFPKIESGDFSSVPKRYERAKKVNTRNLQIGDLVIEISGGSASSGQRTGRCLYITEDILNSLGKNIIPASFCRLLRLDKGKINSKFLYYQIKEMHLSDEISLFENQSTGISNFQFNLFLDECLVKIIDRNKQDYIVGILENLDQKIYLNTQINQTLENIAQAIFKSWFIDFDPVRAKATALADGLTPAQAERAAMSVISGKNAAELDRLQTENPDQYQQLQQLAQAFPSEFEEVEGFGDVPRGWDILKFKDFVTESKEKVGERTGIEEFSVGNNGITPRSEKYKKSLSKTPEKNKIINNGYVVFGMGSQTLNWGIMQLGEGSVSPAYFVYKTNEKIVNYQYLSLFIKAYEQDYQSLIKPTSRQGQSVDREMFLAKEIYIPDNKLLNIFMSTYHSIIKLKDSLNNEIDILVKTRDELLPKLLSGEI